MKKELLHYFYSIMLELDKDYAPLFKKEVIKSIEKGEEQETFFLKRMLGNEEENIMLNFNPISLKSKEDAFFVFAKIKGATNDTSHDIDYSVKLNNKTHRLDIVISKREYCYSLKKMASLPEDTFSGKIEKSYLIPINLFTENKEVEPN